MDDIKYLGSEVMQVRINHSRTHVVGFHYETYGEINEMNRALGHLCAHIG